MKKRKLLLRNKKDSTTLKPKLDKPGRLNITVY